VSLQNPSRDINEEFDTVYRLEHEARFTRERTEREVDTLVRALGLRPSERVLDLACGWGRHLAVLRERGFGPLVGVDVQGAFLEEAAKVLPGVELYARDARCLGHEGEIDAAYCVASALFSEDDAAHEAILASVARALRPGGRFLLDTTNRENLVRSPRPTRSWRREREQLPWILEESFFDLVTGTQHLTQHRVYPDGRTQTRTLRRWHYTLRESADLFRKAGLEVTATFGDWGLNPYTAQSPRMILLAREVQRGR